MTAQKNPRECGNTHGARTKTNKISPVTLIIHGNGTEIKEEIMNHTYEEYLNTLDDAGPKLTELILDRAAQDPNIDLFELKKLVEFAYPNPC